MKDVDKMLRKARTLLGRIVEVLFPGNEDEFMESIGVDPEKYKHKHPDGTFGYDFLKALADTAAEDWEDYEDVITPMVFSEDEQADIPAEGMDFKDEPWKYPGWNSLTSTEKKEILLELGIPEESIDNFIEHAKEYPKKKGKSRNLFGWG